MKKEYKNVSILIGNWSYFEMDFGKYNKLIDNEIDYLDTSNNKYSKIFKSFGSELYELWGTIRVLLDIGYDKDKLLIEMFSKKVYFDCDTIEQYRDIMKDSLVRKDLTDKYFVRNTITNVIDYAYDELFRRKADYSKLLDDKK